MIQQRPRKPGIAYAVLSVALLVLVAVVAFTSRQPPPPTIAEFAPQSVDNITDAPSDQSSSSGRGGGQGAGGTGEAVASPVAPAPIDVPRVRKCVGDPPRQIEDPQSPPCVPYWSGDNGGATSKGVTRDTIKVAYVNDSDDLDDDAVAITNFFNKRFEFYGRKIELENINVGGAGDPNPTIQVSQAVTVDEEIGAFASTSMQDREGTEFTYYDELARRGVVSVHGRPILSSEAHLARFHPYEWNYLTTSDRMFASLGDWTCAQIAGRPAMFAGPGFDPTATRKIGLIWQTMKDGSAPDMSPLRSRLQTCGGLVADLNYVSNQSDAGTMIVELRSRGVSTVICACKSGDLAFAWTHIATTQAYFPEWVISTFLYHDSDLAGQATPAEHSVRMFGLTSFNKVPPIQDDPRVWAIKEGDPSQNQVVTVDPFGVYKQMLVLASGIQMAGPRLTPDAFGRALARTTFPNPGAGAAPAYQARVDLSRSHAMQGDEAVIWWSSSERSYQIESNGAWCYTHLGERHTAGSWPREDPPLFQQPCR